MKLFLDDLRAPLAEDWVVVRTVAQAQQHVLEHGVPDVLSFDHDLGEDEPDAMHFMNWLINSHLDAELDLSKVTEVIIHSANPPGADNLAGLWNGFAQYLGLNTTAIKAPRWD